ncbi:endonuclease/exonuclease/phosphatase family protein [Cellulophaga baltica]|uniref:endonuclease/exonuclease/phosphatase family protein n=1 Tax=Cellulophaga TaxID=104264 RepID=UPI001C07A777|nr:MULTISPECIES: endonuclease/exonuclease/phosphatase family protein [Cellulophaga]MBU2996788.1 endonuclease/exonuclease/phosphatase family protein [Cellulophaga baltica]MDO6768184.1 endonuclease/exonuclease/phosphatase family protein [Cellulophaga sp. 1_MG-2023]
MATIFDTPPLEIQKNLNNLKEDLDAKIPAKKLDKNLLIASWNIRAFGNLTRKWVSEDDDSPKRDLQSILSITEIISRFDVIAIQEVKSNLRALRDTLKLLGNNWSMILTDVSKGSSGNGERMAYLFDTRRVQLSGLASELVVPNEWTDGIDDNALDEQFVRTPYAVSFKSNLQTFILVTLHIKYGKSSKDRIKELKGIATWLADWASNTNAYHQNLITLGDFNIDERGDLLDQTFLSEGLFVPPQLQNEEVTRSIFNETKYYDQIAWFMNSKNIPNLTMDFITGGNYDFVPTALAKRNITKQSLSYLISDHYPLWAEFEL